jgi:hypothetical protein
MIIGDPRRAQIAAGERGKEVYHPICRAQQPDCEIHEHFKQADPRGRRLKYRLCGFFRLRPQKYSRQGAKPQRNNRQSEK